MENMSELYSAYDGKQEERKQIEAKIEKLEASIERLKKKANKIWDNCGWIDMIVRPLGKALCEYCGGDNYDVSGPFGLRCETYIKIDKGTKRGWICVTPLLDPPQLFYDTGETRDDCPSGSIGQLNGMNNVTAPLPDTIPEICELLSWTER